MSIADKIQRLTAAKTAIATAITAKGGTVEQGDGFEDFATDIATIPSGGGGEGVEKKDINFYDIDGKRVYSYTFAEALALDAMPSCPDHSQDFVPLTSQGWNWTLAELKSLSYPQAEIGAIYIPTDGFTHIVYEANENTSMDITLVLLCNTTGRTLRVNWGDGTSSDTTPLNPQRKEIAHTYNSNGTYDIKINALTSNTTFSFSYTQPYDFLTLNTLGCMRGVKSVHLGNENNPSRGGYFEYFASEDLVITIPNGITSSPSCLYSYLRCLILPPSCNLTESLSYSSLRTISLPYTCAISTNSTDYLMDLVNFSLPPAVTLSGTVIRQSTKVAKLWVPEGVTTLSNQAFQGARGLNEVHLPSSLVSMGSQAGEYWSTAKGGALYVAATTPPTLGNYFLRDNWTIYVPYSADHSILDAYKAATNWSKAAARIEEHEF